jgi:serine kinase of HPr protein (carbohydrate metabolism regulator)
VEVKRTSRTTLVGTAPEVIRYYMELRGIASSTPAISSASAP